MNAIQNVDYEHEDFTTNVSPPNSLSQAIQPFLSHITVAHEEFLSPCSDEHRIMEQGAQYDVRYHFCGDCTGQDRCREQSGQWIVPTPNPAFGSPSVWSRLSNWPQYHRHETNSHLHYLEAHQLPVSAYLTRIILYDLPRTDPSTSPLEQIFHVRCHKPFVMHPHTTFVSSQWEGEATIQSAPRTLAKGILEVDAAYWTILGRRSIVLQFFTELVYAPRHLLPLFPTQSAFSPIQVIGRPMYASSETLDFSNGGITMNLSQWSFQSTPFPEVEQHGIWNQLSSLALKAWNLANFHWSRTRDQPEIRMTNFSQV